MSRLSLAIDTFIQHGNALWDQLRGVRQATITYAGLDSSGRNDWVTATIGTAGASGEQVLRNVRIYVGDNANIMAGDVYYVYGKDNPGNPDWRLGERIKSRNPPHGANYAAPIQVMVIPASPVNPDDGFSNPIGIGTESDQTAVISPNGDHAAIARIFYRATVPGSYTIYDQHITDVQVQYKRSSENTWRQTGMQKVAPDHLWITTLGGDITASALAGSIGGALPSDIPYGSYLFWQVDSEIIIAKINVAHALTILQRGADGTTATSHLYLASVVLLSGYAVVHGLEPGTNHDVRVSASTGYGLLGPPSAAVTFTAWKATTVPPIDPATFTVDMRSSGFHLEWQRPLDPATGQVIATRLYYKIWRNVNRGFDGNELLVADRLPNLSIDIPASLWNNDATRSIANWFGIQVIDGFGNASAGSGDGGALIDGVLWGRDNTPPPNPDPANVDVEPTANGIIVTIKSIDTARLDRGWKEYVLFGASDQSGTGATEKARFSDNVLILQVAPDAVSTTYQVVSADWAGNVGALTNDAAHWKYVPSFYWSDRKPLNGNFQLGNSANTFALYWEVIQTGTYAGYTMNPAVTWATTGGINGNKSIVLTYSGSGPRNWGIRATVAVPLNAFADAMASLWAMVTGGDGRDLHVDYRLECFSDDAGTVLLGTYGLSEQDILAPVNGTWYQFAPKNIGKLKDVFSTARTVKAAAVVLFAGGGADPPALTITIDDFLITQ